jgi:murein DD-endopeptidase MepM/ murein hydrolase activator NlpD
MLIYNSRLGSNCHQRAEAAVPLCVVSGLNHKDILFAHLPVASEWVVSSASCSVQRFWNASSAVINLTCAAPEMTQFAPPLPRIKVTQDNIEHFLGEEDNICIWMGYVDKLYKSASDLWQLMEGENPALIRVFIGSVDTMGITGTEAGFKYTIQCRDRMKHLMDTQVSLAPFDIKDDRTFLNQALGGQSESVERSAVILKVAQLGVGYIDLGKDGSPTDLNGMKILPGTIHDLAKVSAASKSTEATKNKVEYPAPDFFYNYGDKPLAATVNNQVLDLEFDPKFNIMTGRLPFNTETVAREFTIEQQVPIELIKLLSNQESYPTEVFASVRDGNYYYCPRGTDLSGLADPARFYRTYYYRAYQPSGIADASFLDPLGKKYPAIAALPAESEGEDVKALKIDPIEPFKYRIDPAQACHNWREERTTVGMYTNFLIVNNSPNNTKDGNVIMMHLVSRPALLAGRSIAGRNYYVIDDNITTRTEAIVLGAQLARLQGKQLRSASMTIVGDPSLIPGELIQVVGSPLHAHLASLELLVEERYGIVEYLERERQSYSDILTKIKNLDKQAPDTEVAPLVSGSNKLNDGKFDLAATKDLVSLGGNNVSLTSGSLAASFKAGATDDAIRIRETKEYKVGGTTTPSESSQGGQTTAPTNDPTGFSSTSLRYPLDNEYKITSPAQKDRKNPYSGKVRDHAGTDYSCPIGTPIYSTADGKITVSGIVGGYGEYIKIDHGNGIESGYGHLSLRQVTVGQIVKSGEKIGLSGNTGGSTGPHLHFEIFVNGAWQPTGAVQPPGSNAAPVISPQLAAALKLNGTQPTSAVPAVAPLPQVGASTKKKVAQKLEDLSFVDAKGTIGPTITAFNNFKAALKTERFNGSAVKVDFDFPYTNSPAAKGSPNVVSSGTVVKITSNFATVEWLAELALKKDLVYLGTLDSKYQDLFVYVGDENSMQSVLELLVYAKANNQDLLKSNTKLQKLFEGLSKDYDLSKTTASSGDASTSGKTLANNEQRNSHFTQEPLSMFRVDGVRHDFNAAGKGGYTCEVIMLGLVN